MFVGRGTTWVIQLWTRLLVSTFWDQMPVVEHLRCLACLAGDKQVPIWWLSILSYFINSVVDEFCGIYTYISLVTSHGELLCRQSSLPKGPEELCHLVVAQSTGSLFAFQWFSVPAESPTRQAMCWDRWTIRCVLTINGPTIDQPLVGWWVLSNGWSSY